MATISQRKNLENDLLAQLTANLTNRLEKRVGSAFLLMHAKMPDEGSISFWTETPTMSFSSYLNASKQY